MRSFLIVEKDEKLLIKKLADELLDLKISLDNFLKIVQEKNARIKQLESENHQIKEMNHNLLETQKQVVQLFEKMDYICGTDDLKMVSSFHRVGGKKEGKI